MHLDKTVYKKAFTYAKKVPSLLYPSWAHACFHPYFPHSSSHFKQFRQEKHVDSEEAAKYLIHLAPLTLQDTAWNYKAN